MLRQALLIASPNAHSPLPGARRDIDNFLIFLKSNAGGAWEDYEIAALIDPTKAQLAAALSQMRRADYAFITFSGHGLHATSRRLSETRICLTSTEDCPVAEINPGNDRHFIVIDACRAIVQVALIEERQNFSLLAKAGLRTPREDIRAAFDRAVLAAEAGRIVAYSCQIGQAAGEEASFGGVFSSAFIGEGSRMATNALSGTPLSIQDVFDAAARVTVQRNAPQRPEIEPGRRIRCFPFAIGT